MRITISEGNTRLNGVEVKYRIAIIIGWHKPNLSIRCGNFCINSSFIDAIVSVAERATDFEIKCDDYRSRWWNAKRKNHGFKVGDIVNDDGVVFRICEDTLFSVKTRIATDEEAKEQIRLEGLSD